jgi:hypothetical protein
MADDRLSKADAEQLQALSIFHYVVAGMQALFGCFPILHFLAGTFMVFGAGLSGKNGSGIPVAIVGGFFMAFAGAWMLVCWTLATCVVVAGRSLALRRRHTFCLVVAGVVAAACVPFGTALGVFTIIVLLRPSVKETFGVTA